MHIKSPEQFSQIIDKLINVATSLRFAVTNRKSDNEYAFADYTRQLYILIYILNNEAYYLDESLKESFTEQFTTKIMPLFNFNDVNEYIYWLSNSIYVNNNNSTIEFNDVQSLSFSNIATLFLVLTNIDLKIISQNSHNILTLLTRTLQNNSKNINHTSVRTYQNKMNILTTQSLWLIHNMHALIELDEKYTLIQNIIIREFEFIKTNISVLTNHDKTMIITRLYMSIESLQYLVQNYSQLTYVDLKTKINISYAYNSIYKHIKKINKQMIYSFASNSSINCDKMIHDIQKLFFPQEKSIMSMTQLSNDENYKARTRIEIINLLSTLPIKLLTKKHNEQHYLYFGLLSECHCLPVISRNDCIDLRAITEQYILDVAKIMDSNKIKLGIFSSGGLFQTLVIIVKLIHINKINDLELTLFDDFIYNIAFKEIVAFFFKTMCYLEINFIVDQSVKNIIHIESNIQSTNNSTVRIFFLPHTYENLSTKIHIPLTQYSPEDLDIIISCHGSTKICHKFLDQCGIGTYIIEAWTSYGTANISCKLKGEEDDLEDILNFIPIYSTSKIYPINSIKQQEKISIEFLETNNLHATTKKPTI